ncbi:MAG: hypothetical protein KGZ79_12955 [Dethiobacter sp.]|nr:hypothetical protein [Dethiobacter sp.]
MNRNELIDLYEKALEKVRQGELEEAEKILLEVHKSDQGHFARNKLAMVRISRGLLPEALETLSVTTGIYRCSQNKCAPPQNRCDSP